MYRIVALLTLVVRTRASYPTVTPEITETACQGEVLNIDCPVGQGLDIKSANYGRSPGNNACGSYSLFGCYTPNSLLAVRAKCQGKSWCEVPANEGFFGGRCQGSDQYLQVRYTCEYPLMSTNYVCEDNTLNVDCKEGRHIVIDHAIFGRVHGNAVCPTDPYWLKSVHCVSDVGLRLVKSKCEGEQWCKVRVSADLFGDPCPGTHKYLFVRYSCRSGSDSSSEDSSSSGSGSNSSGGGFSSGGSGSNSSPRGSSFGGSGSDSSGRGSSSGGSGSNSSGRGSSSGGSGSNSSGRGSSSGGSGSNSSGRGSSSGGSGSNSSGRGSSSRGSGSNSGGSTSDPYH